MEKVIILGVSGSPRKNANTAKLINKALEGAAGVPGVETEFYEMAKKRYHHCTGCYHCLKTGQCIYKDDFQEFVKSYFQADGIIWGAPVYHMAVPGSMKAMLDRFSNALLANSLKRSRSFPRFNKVCGVLTVGAVRYGGQDMVCSFLVNSSLMMNNIAVAGDTSLGNYIGAVGYVGVPTPEPIDRIKRLKSRDVVLHDEKGLELAANLGKRVAEITRIVKAGMSALRKELPGEYFPAWEDLEWD